VTHVVVSGWLLPTGESGANRRLLEVLRAAAEQLGPNERVTLLCAAGTPLPDLPTAIRCMPIEIPALPAAARAIAERRHLHRVLTELRATVYEQGHLPPLSEGPAVPRRGADRSPDLRDLTRAPPSSCLAPGSRMLTLARAARPSRTASISVSCAEPRFNHLAWALLMAEFKKRRP
jgi:hypothetical protein